MTQESKPFLNSNERATNERVQEAITAMHAARSDFQLSRQLGDVDDRDLLLFQASVVNLHDALRPFRHDVRELWDSATRWEQGLDALPTVVVSEPVEKVKTVGLGHQVVEEERQPVLLEESHVLQISYELEEIAREAGFEREPETSKPDTHGGTI